MVAEPLLALEIRARAASLYYRGVSLGRISGDGPFVAELDAVGAAGAERLSLVDADDVSALLGRIETACAAVDSKPGTTTTALSVTTSRCSRPRTAGGDLFASEYLFVDLEYTYGKRRYDLVALRRTEGVTGPGGFANPRLVLVDARCAGQSLTGQNGLDAVGGDVADFAKALGGAHLERARIEMAELAAQKVRLGLLPADLEVRGIDDGMPEFLVLFANYEGIEDSRHDAAIIALHDRLNARHFPTDRLRFAVAENIGALPDASQVLGERRADDLPRVQGVAGEATRLVRASGAGSAERREKPARRDRAEHRATGRRQHPDDTDHQLHDRAGEEHGARGVLVAV